ncbi:hypothetical protein [Peribacillus simplex]|uniref:hypothetical protein n=1 Tax=Peribacillus simplex TaxID=1478 RepID=UPI00366AF424
MSNITCVQPFGIFLANLHPSDPNVVRILYRVGARTAIKLQTLLNRAKENMGSGMNLVVNETILEVVIAYEAVIFVRKTPGYRSFPE